MVDLKENVILRRGVEGRDHIPVVPFWLALIRVAQFALTLLVLILDAYAGSVFGVTYYAGYGFSFFMFAWTLLFLGYIFVTPLWFPAAYNYWAHLGLEIFTTVLWLSAFATLASEAAAWSFVGELTGNSFVTAIDCTKAAAGMGAIVWLLFVVTLIVFSIFLHKHRIAHGKIGNRQPAVQPDVEAQTGEKKVAQVELNQYPQQTYPAANYQNQPESVAQTGH